MGYEKFRSEVERILKEKAKPVTWNEIRESSSKLKQKAPYHVYVQKLQGDIGLVRLKPRGSKEKNVWALRKWFEEDKFKEFLPEKVKVKILCSQRDYAIGANEFWELKRIYPLKKRLNRWDVIEAEVEDFFPEKDKRPESIRIRTEVGEKGVEHLGRIEDEGERIRILEKISETGEFIHTDAWKGKTLGVTKPRFRCFYFYDHKCQFFCDQSICMGHDMEVQVQEQEEGVEVKVSGDKVYFLLEASEQEGGEFIWQKPRVEWSIKSVISLTDPRQRRLL